MAVRPVDLRGALVADSAKGSLRTRDATPLLALPLEGLSAALSHGGPAAIRALADALGSALVPSAREALGDALGEASPEDVAYGINAALARFGLGRIEFERWGDALVARWHDAPATHGPLAELCALALARCVHALAGLDVSAAALGSDGALRVLLAHQTVCAHAIERAKDNASVAAILADLRSESVS
jgi:hypothetical protein